MMQMCSPWAVMVQLILHLHQARLELIAFHQHLAQLLQGEAGPVGVLQVDDHLALQLQAWKDRYHEPHVTGHGIRPGNSGHPKSLSHSLRLGMTSGTQ